MAGMLWPLSQSKSWHCIIPFMQIQISVEKYILLHFCSFCLSEQTEYDSNMLNEFSQFSHRQAGLLFEPYKL